MNENALLEVSLGIRNILDYVHGDLKKVSETDSLFSARYSIHVDQLKEIIINFAQFTNLFEVLFTLDIQQGTGNLRLTPEGICVLDWGEDPDLSPPQLSPGSEDLYQELSTQLSDQKIEVDDLISGLNHLLSSDALIEIDVKFSLNKKITIEKLGLPACVQPLLYVFAEKFIEEVKRANFSEFSELIMPQSKGFLLLLVANTNGIGLGSNIQILGLDSWQSHLPKLQIEENVLKKVDDALLFRKDEVNWEGFDSYLTPHHLNVQTNSLNNPEIVKAFSAQLNMISVIFLANQAKLKDELIECSFKGYKKINILATPNDLQSNSIFKLFNWSYENSSSDKLDIVRHLVSLRVSTIEHEGYKDLLNSANEIHDSAKDNFQIFIKQSVEFYFDTRSKISDYLQKFNDDVGKNIASLASELIANLYKTIGLILGVAIAIVLDSKYTYPIILLTSILYLLYILFVFFVLLGTTYLRFATNIKEYDESFKRFGDVFSKSEVDRLKGKTYQRARWGFLATYAFVALIYSFLGAAAFLLIKYILNFL